MNANKLFSEFSLKKIWDKILKHDKAMSSTLLILSSENWEEQEDGTYKNIVTYSTFKDTDKLTVDLYDEDILSDTLLTEYEQYIDGFEIVNGALVATANTKPTQTMTVVVKGEFEVNQVEVSGLDELFDKVDEVESKVNEVELKVNEAELKISELELKADEQTSSLEEMNSQFDNMNTQLQTIIEALERGIAPESLSGSITLTVGGSAQGGKHMIVFETPFASVPTVTLSSSNFRIGVYTSDITKASFVINYGNSSSNTHSSTITWSAVV